MIKKIFLSLSVLFFFGSCAFAERFYINNYDVNLKVDRSKNVHVTEKIDAVFTESSHGIVREIPFPFAEIKNISVSEKCKISNEGSNCFIKIGDANKYIKGNHTYTISYDYKFYDDKDEFYFNITGTKWYATINHVNFKVEMPAPFDYKKVGLSVGKYGTKGFSQGAEYTVTQTSVEGNVFRKLSPLEGVTIRFELPYGYFYKNNLLKQKFSIIIMLLSTIVSFFIWFKYGKDERIIPCLSFYPPADMSVLDTELLYNEAATTKGIVATIVDLAQKGFIKITDKKDGFVLEKLKEYDGDDVCEKKLLNALFKSGKNSVSEKTLKKVTYVSSAVEKILETKNKEKTKYYEPEDYAKDALRTMQYSIGVLALVLSYACSNFVFRYIATGLIIVGLLLIGQWMLYVLVEDCLTPKTRNIVVVLINLFILFPLFMLISVILETQDYAYLSCATGFACVVVSLICFHHFRKRTKPAGMIYGELLGLKKFIKTAEINKLKLLVDENPEYFYSILPYAYLFGLSKKWISKFEKIIKINPDWYEGKTFQVSSFINFTKVMDKATQPYISDSSSSGFHFTSSGGGGGFSGGGGGGGGGHSW